MPRFHFDTLDRGKMIPDETGIELPSREAARAQSARLLADIFRDMAPNEGREVVVEVSDEEGRPLFRMALFVELEELA